MTPRIVLVGLLATVGCAANDEDPAIGSDGESTGAEGSTSTRSTGGSTTDAGSTGADETTGPAAPVVPEAGFWRWESPSEVVDGCMLSFDTFTYGLTQIIEPSEAEFSLQAWGGMIHTCPLAGSEFSCEPLPLQGLPAPAVTTAEFDGRFETPTSGSMAFRNSADCRGTECGVITTDTGIAFPCESTALTTGFRMEDVDLVDEGCAAEGTLVNSMTTAQAVLQIFNDTDEVITPYHLDFLGERVAFLIPIEPGESMRVYTTLAVPYLLANPQDECLGIYVATEDAGMIHLR